MTIGIYALYWPQNSMVYVGKSINIERRLLSHKSEMRNNTHNNYKVQKQFQKYGYPETYILEQCKINELNKLESMWIIEFNSVYDGLNITDADNISYSGTETGKSKYTRKTILKVFSLLYNSKLLLKDIAKRIKVNESLPTNIAYNSQHLWLQEEYPEQYSKMLSNNETRRSKNKSGLNNPRSKYTKYQILKVFSLLYKTKLSRAKIAARTNTKDSLAKSILDMGSHKWLKEEYPKQYQRMLDTRR